MRKRGAPPPTSKKAPAPKPPPKRARKTPSKTKGDDDDGTPVAARKKPTRLFPTDPTATRRVLAFDVGIVNLAYAVVTLTGADDFAIESLAANNIMRDDPPGGPPTDDDIIAAAVTAGPKAKGRGAKEPLKVLTERLTAYLWARADRLLGRRPHAVVIEQQSKKALRLSALGAVIHAFVLNYYLARGEEIPPVFMQSGRQKLRVVFRPLPSMSSSSSSSSSSGSSGGGIAAWCGPPGAGNAPRLVTRFRIPPPLRAAATATTTTVVKTAPRRTSKATSEKANDNDAKDTGTAKQETKAKAKPKSKAKQKDAEQKAIWRANKKHAVVNFAPMLTHYPGCRRWKPLFERSKKKDDLADAALHAVFLLKAGGTRLARTKDLDDASLIVLPARPDNDDDDSKSGDAQEAVAKRKSRSADARHHAAGARVRGHAHRYAPARGPR